MKRFLSLVLIICLIALSLPVQVMAGECTHFIEVRDYNNTIRPNSMITGAIVGYVKFKNNNSDIPYYNATITNAYMNVQTNGSMHVDVYRTYLGVDINHMAYEFMTEMDFIAQPGVGVNSSIPLPYLDNYTLFGSNVYTWTPCIVVLMTNLENYTINVEVIAMTYWDVYFVEDDVVLTTDETETTETTEQADDETESSTTTIPITTNGGTVISMWTIIGGFIVVVEGIVITVLVRSIMRKRRELGIEI